MGNDKDLHAAENSEAEECSKIALLQNFKAKESLTAKSRLVPALQCAMMALTSRRDGNSTRTGVIAQGLM